jgi:hypothetical protein
MTVKFIFSEERDNVGNQIGKKLSCVKGSCMGTLDKR